MRPLASLSGHFWSLAPTIRHEVLPLRDPGGEPWEARSRDPRFGDARIRGRLKPGRGNLPALVVVHGLGGCWDRFYTVRAAQAAERRGMTCLRMALRGADHEGEDLYHAGMTADLDAAASCPELAPYPGVVVLGYSLGGHLALRYAGLGVAPAVRAVAAVSAPVDLALGVRFIDRSAPWFYRKHMLDSLREDYAAIARRRPVPTPPERLRGVGRIREWDTLTVVPHFGFRDADDYYASQSAAAVISGVLCPTLYVGSRRDPVIPPATVLPALSRASAAVEVRWLDRGGHVGFPPGTGLGGAGGDGRLEDAVLAWLERRARAG